MKTYIKKYCYIVIILIVFLVSIKLYNFVLPKAYPMELPNIDKITMIQISKNNIKSEFTDKKSIQEIANVFIKAKRTRRLTVNDAPTVNGYCTVKFII